MANLTIRGLPDSLRRKLKRAAKKDRRSTNSQALVWLERSAAEWQSRLGTRDLLAAIHANREAMYRQYGSGDSVKLIRKMRGSNRSAVR
jgi:plasmid stability protein